MPPSGGDIPHGMKPSMTDNWSSTISSAEDAEVTPTFEEALGEVVFPTSSRNVTIAPRILEPADQYPVIRFKVPGLARPQGSKTASVNKYTGRAVMREANKNLPQWRTDVAQAADHAMDGHELLTGPLLLDVAFIFVRPASHFTKTGKLVKGAPDAPTGHNLGDTSKLVRAIEDAMQGIVYKDDAQITTLGRPRKRWGIAAATYITVFPDPLDP